VDEHFQVVDDVHAAGDIARFVDWRTGKPTRIEHWRLAQQQGRIAAHNMAGNPATFESVPFFWTTQFGLHIRYLGHTDGWDKIIFHGDPEDQNFMAFYVQGEDVTAVAGCRNDAKMAATAELMRAGHMPRPGTLEEKATRVVEEHKG
jgi:hypothetical protein